MNSKRKLIVGVLALIVVMTMGYALFSETVTINGTAKGKGGFSITTSIKPGLPDELINVYKSIPDLTPDEKASLNNDMDQAGFKNDSYSVNGNSVTFGTELLYPSAKRYFIVRMKNTGDIDAWLPIYNISGYFAWSEFLKGTKHCIDQSKNGIFESGECNYYEKQNYMIDVRGIGPDYNIFIVFKNGKSTFDVDNPNLSEEEINQLSKDFNDHFIFEDGSRDGKFILKPGEELGVSFEAYWPDSRYAMVNGQIVKQETTYEFPWRQVTN